jgi:hypothetical protein
VANDDRENHVEPKEALANRKRLNSLLILKMIESEMIEIYSFLSRADQVPFRRTPRVFELREGDLYSRSIA